MSDFEEETFETKRSTGPTYAAFAAVSLVATIAMAIDSVDPGFRIVVICLGIAGALVFLREALIRIRVRHSEFVCETLLGDRRVRYSDVIDMTVETRNIGRNYHVEVDVIVITRRRGFPVVLRHFDETIADPFGALQRRWSAWMDRVHPRWRNQRPLER